MIVNVGDILKVTISVYVLKSWPRDLNGVIDSYVQQNIDFLGEAVGESFTKESPNTWFTVYRNYTVTRKVEIFENTWRNIDK